MTTATLDRSPFAPSGTAPSFSDRVARDGSLTPLSFTTFQINLGKRCNQACRHCHVDASPIRTETMSREVADQCLAAISASSSVATVDITGGAPEMNAQFRYLVEGARTLGKHVIDRCNLTILEEPGYEDLAEFLRDMKVEIIASLPCYTEGNTDKQRGNGVFAKSIAGLQRFNRLGYGKGTGLKLNLVYNPGGASLSPSQEVLERDYKRRLFDDFGVVFDQLYCMNNLPISRFLDDLRRQGRLDQYMDLLAGAYNPATLDGLMCRHQISVGYDGGVYDCDFNQMLGMTSEPVSHVKDFVYGPFMARSIRTGNHCYGCTAGAGSSCGGAVT
jgi:radical SAM/Cys-rich protein